MALEKTDVTVVAGTSVDVVIKHEDGRTSVISVQPEAILYDETGMSPIGAVIPGTKRGDEFVGINTQ